MYVYLFVILFVNFLENTDGYSIPALYLRVQDATPTLSPDFSPTRSTQYLNSVPSWTFKLSPDPFRSVLLRALYEKEIARRGLAVTNRWFWVDVGYRATITTDSMHMTTSPTDSSSASSTASTTLSTTPVTTTTMEEDTTTQTEDTDTSFSSWIYNMLCSYFGIFC